MNIAQRDQAQAALRDLKASRIAYLIQRFIEHLPADLQNENVVRRACIVLLACVEQANRTHPITAKRSLDLIERLADTLDSWEPPPP